MLKFIKILLSSFSIVLLFTTISLATFIPNDFKPSSSSNEFQPISIIDSILDEYDDTEYTDENDNEDSAEKKNSGALTLDSVRLPNKTSSPFNTDSFKPDNAHSVDEISSISSKISSLLSTMGIVIIILPIICLVCGILYIVKSKASMAKKITIGIIIILMPFIIFTIGALIIIVL